MAERGVDLYWWQRLVAVRLLEHDRAGRLVWRDVFLSVARQSGKSTFLSVLADWRSEAAWMFGEPQLVMHTADTLRHAIDVWQLATLRADREGFKVRRGAGMQAIEKGDDVGAWVIRSQNAVVGSSVSLGIADEAQGVKLGTITENLSPTLVERQQSQMLLVSTSHSKCTDLMPTYRLGATGDLDSPNRMLMLEWSADPTLELGDPIAARQASPHWSKGRELDIGEAVARALATPPGHELRVAVDAQWYNRWPSLASRGSGEAAVGCRGVGRLSRHRRADRAGMGGGGGLLGSGRRRRLCGWGRGTVRGRRRSLRVVGRGVAQRPQVLGQVAPFRGCWSGRR